MNKTFFSSFHTAVVGLVVCTACFACNRRSDAKPFPIADGGTNQLDAPLPPLPDGSICRPGRETCADGIATICNSQGTQTTTFECSAELGLTCTPNGCAGPCAPRMLGSTYVGCEYYPTVTSNTQLDSFFHFAVAIAAATSERTEVRVTRGSATVATRTIEGNQLAVIHLPWVNELKGPKAPATLVRPPTLPSVLARGGAYRLVSDRPVTVYQFNPLEYKLAEIGNPECVALDSPPTVCGSFTNDASLLLPANALGTSYVTTTWHAAPLGPSFVAITATTDNTRVTIRGDVARVVPGTTGLDSSGSGTIDLMRGDVLQLRSTIAATVPRTLADARFSPHLSDLQIEATHPVQVIGGVDCGLVPDVRTGYCDHLEDTILPRLSYGNEYLLTNFAPPSARANPGYALSIQQVTGRETTVSFDPPISPAITLTADSPRAELLEVRTDVKITATNPIAVGQFIHGSILVEPESENPSSDPSMIMAPPQRQYRMSYTFYASPTFDANFVNVVAPSDATVIVDEAELTSDQFTVVGESGFRVARVRLTDSGTHTIRSTMPAGIVVYGYGAQTSYAYPGGLDLTQVPF